MYCRALRHEIQGGGSYGAVNRGVYLILIFMKGSGNLDYKRYGSKYVIRIDKGEEIIESMKEFALKSGVKLGSITGIGAVNKATIGLFDTARKVYISRNLCGDFELVSITGNITTMNGEVYIHAHACLADIESRTYGGHMNSAVISATSEVMVDTFEGCIDRELNIDIGLNLLKF
jgi:predicted DNA-binding protein with PD1-like motif